MTSITSGQILDQDLVQRFQELVEVAKQKAFAHTPYTIAPFMEGRSPPLHHVQIEEQGVKTAFYVASAGVGKNAILVLNTGEKCQNLSKLKTRDTSINNCLLFKESRDGVDVINWDTNNQKPEDYIAQLHNALKHG